jgi:beta-lactamase superfamily II metal-dependent hydrolase
MDLLLNGHSCWIKEKLTDKQIRVFDRAISKKDVDILIAPHHGLKSSFSADFMKKLNALKLVIIPEKIQYSDSKREVDTRYWTSSS